MNFYVTKQSDNTPPRGAEFPCITLFQDSWNDYGLKTLYHARLWIREDESVDLGSVKILQRMQNGEIARSTQLPDVFTQLGADFCSLGQGRQYYEELIEHDFHTEALKALRDIVLIPSNAEGFDDYDAFQNSLLRFSEAVDNYRNAGKLFGPLSHQPASEAMSLQLAFTFRVQFVGFSVPHEVKFDFQEHKGLPHRVMAFVGKNGTGKTAVLAEMAKHLSGIEEERKGVFEPRSPFFSRTVVVSYSPFGPFRYPRLQTSSYRYCGILSTRGRLDSSILEKRIKKGISEIHEQNRRDAWLSALHTAGLFDNEPVIREVESIDSPDEVFRLWGRMSSGHYYASLLLTDVVANLLEDSLLIIDEPELYLHPNMVSGLMRAVDELLGPERFKSYALVATHSPIVIQEIPGRSVRVFSRIGSEPHCLTLDFESFGESLTNIVNQVFGATREDKNYMFILERLSQDRTEEEVDALFNGKLGMNAMAFVSALISARAKGGSR